MRKILKSRNPIARVVKRLRPKVKDSKFAYKRQKEKSKARKEQESSET